MIHVVRGILGRFGEVHLASGSPRRKNMLNTIGLTFTVTPSTFDEKSLDKSQFDHPKQFVMECAKQKALDVHNCLKQKGGNSHFVIATDTVVVAGNDILEKPLTHENALRMLTRLNKEPCHEVYSGVTLIKFDEDGMELRQFYERTEVVFGDIPSDVIHMYANTQEPLDKAGGYGIQGEGATLVKEIKGCYFNVQGFPIYRFCEEVYHWLKQEQT